METGTNVKIESTNAENTNYNECTMCKITHFARKMGGQNFHKFNAVITSRDYI